MWLIKTMVESTRFVWPETSKAILDRMAISC